MKQLIVPFLFVAALVLAACGIFNVGGTNEDGTPKTPAAARTFLRSLSDASLRTWATQALREKQPELLVMFDVDGDGELDLTDVEAMVNVEDPAALADLLVVAITIYQSQQAAK